MRKKRILALALALVMVGGLMNIGSMATAEHESTFAAEASTITATANSSEKSEFHEYLESKYIDPDRVFSSDMRWWVGSAAQTDETLLEEIQAIYDGGFRGLELCMQTMAGSDNAVYGYGSAMWQHKWKLMMNKLLDLGMGVYLTSGAAFSTSNVPGLDPDSQFALQVVAMSQTPATVTGGAAFNGPLPLPAANARRSRADFIGAYAFRQSANNVADFDSIIDLTHLVTPGPNLANPTENAHNYDYLLNWTPADNGTWRVYGLWYQGSYQTANPAIMPSYATNYFDVRGVEALREFWEEYYLDDPVLNQKIMDGDVQVFMDSLEINRGGGITWWAEDMAERFIERKGYDIRPYLFLIDGGIGDSVWSNAYPPIRGTYDLTDNNSLREKIISDYMDHLTVLYMERMLDPLKEWLNSVGIKTRAQISYGKPIEISEPIMSVDYPEAENRNQYNQVDYFRLWTGGSKLQNKLLSTELSCQTNSGQNGMTRQLHFRDAYASYAAGFQRVIWHIWQAGYGYGTNIAWPGAVAGFNMFHQFATREPSSRDYDEFNAHLGRIQQLLQTGKSRTDVGFVNNRWVTGMAMGGGIGSTITGMNWQLAHQGIFYRSTELQDNGYTYDYFSPKFLYEAPEVYFDQATKTIEPAGYKALVLFQNWLDIRGAEEILDLAKQGLPVVIVDGAAARTPFNDGEDGGLAGIITELKSLPTVRTAAVRDPIDYFAPVAGGYDDEVMEKLQELGVFPYTGFTEENHQILTQSREDDEGNRYLYIYNYCPDDYHDRSHKEEIRALNHGTNIKTEIKVEGTFIPYFIDAWSGRVTELAHYRYEDGQTVFPIDLDYDNIALYAFEAVDQGKLHIVSTNAESSFAAADGMVIRATESGRYTAAMSNGGIYQQDVIVPTSYDITGWDLTVESWTPGANGSLRRAERIGDLTTQNSSAETIILSKNVRLETLTTWNNIPELAEVAIESVAAQGGSRQSRNIAGTGLYKAEFNWDAAAADGAYLNFGETLVEGMKVWINGIKVGGDVSTNPTKLKRSISAEVYDENGSRVTISFPGKDIYTGGVSMTKPIADIAEYLVDGVNEIVIDYSSNITNIMIARGNRTISLNNGNWWGFNIDYREFGPKQAVIVPYVNMGVSRALAITNGTGGGDYAPGTAVTVAAGAAPSGQRFSGWTASGVALSAAQQSQNPLTFIMPDSDVTLTATYTGISPDRPPSGTGPGIATPPVTPPGNGDETPPPSGPDYTPFAQELFKLGLFQGYGNDAAGNPMFGLDDELSRIQALVLTLRLLGLEDAVQAHDVSHPFNDVSGWQTPYVAYAFANGLTTGVSEDRFAPHSQVTLQQFTTFMLRALKYSDTDGEDFDYADAIEFALSLGLLTDELLAEFGSASFLRGEAVRVMVNALLTEVNEEDGGMLLFELVDAEVFSQAAAEAFLTVIS